MGKGERKKLFQMESGEKRRNTGCLKGKRKTGFQKLEDWRKNAISDRRFGHFADCGMGRVRVYFERNLCANTDNSCIFLHFRRRYCKA